MKDSSLTIGERRKLTQLEETIDRGVKSFIDVGHALIAIRDGALYSDVDKTFEGYCKKRWGFSRPHAYRLIESAKVIDNLSPMGDIDPPTNERQARVLAEIEDVNQQADVWAKANETAPKDKAGNPKVTAAHVAATAKEVLGNGKPKKPETDKPRPSGKQLSDPRPWESWHSLYGKLKRATDDLHKHKRSIERRDAMQKKMNEVHDIFKEWRNA